MPGIPRSPSIPSPTQTSLLPGNTLSRGAAPVLKLCFSGLGRGQGPASHLRASVQGYCPPVLGPSLSLKLAGQVGLSGLPAYHQVPLLGTVSPPEGVAPTWSSPSRLQAFPSELGPIMVWIRTLTPGVTVSSRSGPNK